MLNDNKIDCARCDWNAALTTEGLSEHAHLAEQRKPVSGHQAKSHRQRCISDYTATVSLAAKYQLSHDFKHCCGMLEREREDYFNLTPLLRLLAAKGMLIMQYQQPSDLD